MKLRSRLAATVVVLSLVTLGGSFWAVYVANNRVQEHQLDVALVHEAHEEAREAGQTGGGQLMISARPGPQANDVGPLTKYAAIYAPDGSVLASTDSFRTGAPPLASLNERREGRPFDLWQGHEHLRAVLVQIPVRSQTLLLLAAPRSDLDGDEAFLGRAMASVFAFALGWVLLVSIWVVRYFTRGHESIANVARRVASGDLTARIELSDRDDEVAQLGRDVNQMIIRLSALLSAHQAFIAHAAHELRSPLTALYGELSHAVRKSRSAEEYQLAIAEALDATKRLMVLAEDLLTLARLSEADEEADERVDLDSIIERARRSVAPVAESRGVTLHISGQTGLVTGRALDLERLMRNLLENAVRHSPEQRVVRVLLESGSEHVVRVCNESAPIAESERDRIFEPFVRGAYASADDHPGAGLGLAIARQIVVSHGGSIALAEANRDGVEFVVRLPLASTSGA